MATTTNTSTATGIETELELFSDSTHAHFYNASSNKWEITLSVYILLLQYALEIFIFWIVQYELVNEDSVSVTINNDQCQNYQDNGNYTEFSTSFGCNAENTIWWNSFAVFFSSIVLGKFLFYDIIAAVKGYKINRIASIFILLECLFAFIAGNMFFVGTRSISAIDILLGAVAVIFIHDIDESVKKAIDLLPRNHFICVVPFVLSVTGCIITVVLTVIYL